MVSAIGMARQISRVKPYCLTLTKFTNAMELYIWQFSCYVLIVIRTGQEQANVRLQYCQLFSQKIIVPHLIVKNSLLRLSDSTVATELVDVHPYKVQVVYSVQFHIETMGILPKE